MKKLLLIALLMLTLVFTAVACNPDDTTDDTTAGDTTVNDVTEEPTNASDDTTATPDDDTTVAPDDDTTVDPGDDTTVTPDDDTTVDPGDDTTVAPDDDVTTEEPVTEDPLKEVYDIDSNSASVEFGAAGYTGKVFQLMNYGNSVLLGEYDLSQYASIIITYGSDGGAKLGDVGSQLVLTASGPVSDGNNQDLADAVIIGSVTLTNPEAGWVGGDRAAVITLDTDYSGPVYLCHKMASGDGIAVSSIVLMKKEPPKAWDEDKSVVAHQSFDQLFKGNCSADEATNNGLNFFQPGQSAGWDKTLTFTDFSVDTISYWGWVALKSEVGQFGYQIDDGKAVYSDDFAIVAGSDVVAAAASFGGDYASRMLVRISLAGLDGTHSVKVLYKDTNGATVILCEFTVNLPAMNTNNFQSDANGNFGESTDDVNLLNSDLTDLFEITYGQGADVPAWVVMTDNGPVYKIANFNAISALPNGMYALTVKGRERGQCRLCQHLRPRYPQCFSREAVLRSGRR